MTSATVQVINPVKNVQEFMRAIWTESSRLKAARLIYRGQSQGWDLLPRLFRDTTRSVTETEELEKKILFQFKARSPYLLPSSPVDELDWLSLAQHHGLPTRLLDWSANPLMALFFAVETPDPKSPTVWVYHATQTQLDKGADMDLRETPREVELTTILEPSRHSQRVAAQAGWHTLHRFHGKNRHAIAMNDLDFHRKRLAKVRVENAAEIRTELKDMGIHAATVYGDLTSVCREIQNELEVPFIMRRNDNYLAERQHDAQVEVVALLLANGKSLKPGDSYRWMHRPDDTGWSVGARERLDSELLKEAIKRARLYDPSFRYERRH